MSPKRVLVLVEAINSENLWKVEKRKATCSLIITYFRVDNRQCTYALKCL